MSHNEWSIQTVPARHTLGTASPSITFLSSLDLFNIAHLHRYFLLDGCLILGLSGAGRRFAGGYLSMHVFLWTIGMG
jgi:hypothetical protein